MLNEDIKRKWVERKRLNNNQYNDGGYMAIKVEPIHHKKHLIEHNILTIRG